MRFKIVMKSLYQKPNTMNLHTNRNVKFYLHLKLYILNYFKEVTLICIFRTNKRLNNFNLFSIKSMNHSTD